MHFTADTSVFLPQSDFECRTLLVEDLSTSSTTTYRSILVPNQLHNYIKSKNHSNLLNDALTLLPTLSKYSWNLFSTSLERFVQLLRIFSICSCWLSQVRWKVSWWGNRLLILFRKSLVTVVIPSKEWAKSSLHFLVTKKKTKKRHVNVL